jgi:hypothetical protein
LTPCERGKRAFEFGLSAEQIILVEEYAQKLRDVNAGLVKESIPKSTYVQIQVKNDEASLSAPLIIDTVSSSIFNEAPLDSRLKDVPSDSRLTGSSKDHESKIHSANLIAKSTQVSRDLVHQPDASKDSIHIDTADKNMGTSQKLYAHESTGVSQSLEPLSLTNHYRELKNEFNLLQAKHDQLSTINKDLSLKVEALEQRERNNMDQGYLVHFEQFVQQSNHSKETLGWMAHLLKEMKQKNDQITLAHESLLQFKQDMNKHLALSALRSKDQDQLIHQLKQQGQSLKLDLIDMTAKKEQLDIQVTELLHLNQSLQKESLLKDRLMEQTQKVIELQLDKDALTRRYKSLLNTEHLLREQNNTLKVICLIVYSIDGIL